MTQQQALDILKLGHNAYITGPAGSGKTYLLNQYISYLLKHEAEVGVTASTGIAATHMGGITIHSWTGLGIKSELSPYDLDALVQKSYLHKRISKAKVLIIDEISMLHDFRLDLVDEVLKAFKKNDLPFGGIQVILCGDFFQLPPISREGEQESQFVYHSRAWREADLKICYLEEQFRQTDDKALSVLNDIRENMVTAETRKHLEECYEENKKKVKSELSEHESIQIAPTRLYTHNADVDYVNQAALKKLDTESMSYKMNSRGNDILSSILKKSCLAPEELVLKKGARVMFVKNNFDKGYVNGTLGEVISLKGEFGGPIVKISRTGKYVELEPESWKIEEEGSVKAEIKQIPLRLAWAITVHKSQGMSLDAVEVDLSKSFEPGMGYVALSRVRSLNGLTILGINENALKVNDEVLEYDEQLRQKSLEAVGEFHEMPAAELQLKQQKFLESVARLKSKKESSGPSHKTTYEFLKEGLSLKEMAEKRAMTQETILSHIEKLLEEDEKIIDECEHLRKAFPKRHFDVMSEVMLMKYKELKDWRLAPVKEYLDKNKKTFKLSPLPTYKDIQIVRLFVKSEHAQ